MNTTARFASVLLLAAPFAAPAFAQMSPDLRVSTGRPVGAADADSVSLAAGGAQVYVAWADARSGTNGVYANRSLDGGRSWLASDVRVDHAAPGGAASAPRLVAARTTPTVLAVWIDTRNGGQDVYCNRSTDGGVTWAASDVRLDTSAALGTGAAVDARIALSGSSVYVVWNDLRAGGDVRINVSHDSGLSWLASDVQLNGVAGTASNPEVAAADPFVHVVWNDARNGQRDVYAIHTANSAASWLAEVRLNQGVAAGTADATAPRLAISQQHVYVAWIDARNAPGLATTGNVWFVASHDSGTSWPVQETRLDNSSGAALAGGCSGVQLAATGSAVHATWSDGRTSTTNRDVFVNGSTNAGVLWRGDVRVDLGNAPGSALADAPQITAATNAIEVAWLDRRSGTPRVFANRSSDAGVSWLAGDLRLDGGSGGTLGARQALLAASGNSVYAAWADDRGVGNGNRDVYATLANGFQPYGTGTPGQFGGIPLLAGTGQMVVGASASINVSNGLGGAFGLLVAGFGTASQVAQPLLGGTLLVQPSVTFGITLTGPAGVPGVGTRNTAIAIPATTIYLGTNLNFQALFVDAGAVQGVSMSNAVATWIG